MDDGSQMRDTDVFMELQRFIYVFNFNLKKVFYDVFDANLIIIYFHFMYIRQISIYKFSIYFTMTNHLDANQEF